MVRTFNTAEVATHNSPESCWVALYGDVWDVTDFIPKHPGGSKIILKLAGRDATEEYDPIHPPGTLEENLASSCKLGRFDGSISSPKVNGQLESEKTQKEDVNLHSLLNLNEIEALAAKRLSKKAWAYYYSASDDEISKHLNSDVYKSILLRPSVFVDCTRCSLTTDLLGYQVGSPLYVAPAAMARLAHPTGEQGIAQGISSLKAVQIVSNNASMTPEQIIQGSPADQIFGWQLYVQTNRKKSEDWLFRINRLSNKFKFIVLTLDAPVPGKRELDERLSFEKVSLPTASDTEAISSKSSKSEKSVEGIGRQLFQGTAADLSWAKTLSWLAQHTSLPILLKGIQTHEDAYLAAQYFPQVRGIIISNHGGRAADTAAPPIYTLLEIRKYCPEVFNRIEVWIDGGIKRGTDIIKALCLGARAVGIGRAALYGLSVGGGEGVKRTFDILHAEMETCMRLLGVEKISDLDLRYVNTRALEKSIYDGPFSKKSGLWTNSKL